MAIVAPPSKSGSKPSHPLPFVELVPAIVVVFGLLAAIAIGAVGVYLLRDQSDAEATLRAKVVAPTLAERLSSAPLNARQALVKHAAESTKIEILIVDASGRVIEDGSISPPPDAALLEMLRVHEGKTDTSAGGVLFSVAPLAPPDVGHSLIVFVPASSRSRAAESLFGRVAVFSLILLGVAALVAYAVARDVLSDVQYVKERIQAMAKPGADPVGQLIPVRTVDQVGAITNAFNELVGRFTEAERSYKEDLHLALSLEQDKSAFLAALSHELKTPLNIILGFADVLLSEVEGPLSDDARENLEMVRNSGAHLNELIRDILDLSALESGELTLSRVLTNVLDTAEAVVREHRVAASEKHLTLTLEGTDAQAWADPVRVRQILSNLIGNAVKFTQDGSVQVRVSTQDKFTCIEVADTGPGISPKAQAAIFQFMDVGDNARGAGSGLGLAITRRLVEVHDGEIKLQSKLGQGSSFTIMLPRTPRGKSHSRALLTDPTRDSIAGRKFRGDTV